MIYRHERFTWALSRFSHDHPRLFSLLRQPLRLWPEGKARAIWRGYAKGMKWVGCGARNHHWLGIYEYPMQVALSRVLGPGEVFYDVGANVGFLSLVGWKMVGPRGQVFAFEPNPQVSTMLSRNIVANRLENISLVECAVGKISGRARFVLQGASMGYLKDVIDRLPEQYSNQGQEVSVALIALDEFVRTHPTPQVIKMDIERAEIDALEGMAQLLASNPPVILGEFHGEQNVRLGTSLLSSYGYWFYDLETGIEPAATVTFWTLALPPTKTPPM